MPQTMEFNAIRISIAAPEQVKNWSYGEVTKPETINYRTLRPEKDGLFCERIFGPTKDWECFCGKYKKIRYKGVICDRCGVEVARSKVRRERMAHIQLAAPVAHVWFSKGIPSRLGLLLDLSPRNLERVLYFAKYIITQIDEDKRSNLIQSLNESLNRGVVRNGHPESQLLEETDGTTQESQNLSDGDEGNTNGVQPDLEVDNGPSQKEIQAQIDALEDLRPMQLLTEANYRELRDKYSDIFKAGMGAEGILAILQKMDLETLKLHLQEDIVSTSGQRRKKAIKRLRVVESLIKSGNEPQWMILSMLPVLPPDLRPMVQLDGGRFATSDLNDLYRRVINRNNRLKRLLDLGAPEIIVRNEKRMLQEAVDALIDNGRVGKAISGSHNHKLKSLADLLRGKQGRFRQNLLGKRVDYSGRSVIVVGPNLALNQCGLPKRMALELFKPFVMNRLILDGHVHNIKGAKRMVERVRPEVWDILEEVIAKRPVLLNRAPTLHRLGIQAFEPVLVEGSAIKIHPLVCTAFNADFDGDQMAVHVPLSKEAVQEARQLMLSTQNMLSPSSGEPIVAPTLDMVFGCYYLTTEVPNDDMEDYLKALADALSNEVSLTTEVHNDDVEDYLTNGVSSGNVEALKFNDPDEAKTAYEHGLVDLRASVLIKQSNNGSGTSWFKTTVGRIISAKVQSLKFNDLNEARMAYENREVDLRAGVLIKQSDNDTGTSWLQTTVGRIIFNEVLPESLSFRNEIMDKNLLKDIAAECYRTQGNKTTAEVLDKIKSLGFYYAGQSGTTIAINDIEVPAQKTALIESATGKIDGLEEQFQRGLITEEERYNTAVRIWTDTSDQMTKVIEEHLPTYGGVYLMAISGAKGNIAQIKQMAGMRGLMSNPRGRIIELPIKSSFREGLSVLEYFISTHGARKGLADTALRTADSGYLTRRLIDVSQEVIILEHDCGTTMGITIEAHHNNPLVSPFASRILGRTAASAVADPSTGEIILERDEEITEDMASKLVAIGIEEIHVRSPLNCEARSGMCSLCYGRNPATGQAAILGEAVGVMAAQSIGEPGTQLTMRTFHTGGIAGVDITSGLPRVEELFEARAPKGQASLVEIDGVVERIEDGEERWVKVTSTQESREEYPLPTGYLHQVADGGWAEVGTILANPEESAQEAEENVPQSLPVIARIAGRITINGNVITLAWEEKEVREYLVSPASQPVLDDGATVNAGDPLTLGPLNPQDILRILGREAVQKYLLDEVQKVYRSQGVSINDKHIEVIVRQMLKKVRVDVPGDTDMLPGELVDRVTYEDANAKVLAEGGEPAMASPALLGVTRASLSTDSFLAAASFQETARVLTESSMNGAVDYLEGLKENVIIGRLIPANLNTSPEGRQRLGLAADAEGSDPQAAAKLTLESEAIHHVLEAAPGEVEF
ncbi:DNA-directed RNA polymerase subunit beta' [SAR202 cluster bacterium AC-647-N09_OGT_505m]|nr:DNA-directed RNA polymerase subunit beta' [SAR202 cluster bacterium AC-647-N09_OGT_505m]